MMGSLTAILPFSPARHIVHPTSAREHDAVSSFLSGTSLAVNQLRAQIRRVGPYFRVASLSGEPGCGAEAVSRSLHELCPLRDQRYLALSAADAEDFLKTEPLATNGVGLLYFSHADKLSRNAQTALLRLLRTQTHQSTRVVACVGRGLKAHISAGLYSTELAAALGSLRIPLPTLRERASDISILIHDALQLDRRRRAQQGDHHHPIYLSDEFLSAAVRCSWPGNLRQLHAVVEWLLKNKSGGTLLSGDLMAALEATAQTVPDKPASPRLVRLETVVQEHIRNVLIACEGNKLRASEVLGISRSTLYRMLEASASPGELLLAG